VPNAFFPLSLHRQRPAPQHGGHSQPLRKALFGRESDVAPCVRFDDMGFPAILMEPSGNGQIESNTERVGKRFGQLV
jgi:hypothetical protein